MFRTKMLGMAALVAGGIGIATAADAAPLPVPAAGGDQAGIAQVGFGCPYGFVPNRWGGCRRPLYGYGGGYGGYGGYRYGGYRPYGYYRPRPVYRPYGFYGPRPYY